MFDYSEDWHRDTRSRRRINSIWNFLTVMVMLSILPVLGMAFLIYMYPYSSINPFPPEQVELFPAQTAQAGVPVVEPSPFLPSYSTDTAITLVPPAMTPQSGQTPVVVPTATEAPFTALYDIQNNPDSIDTQLINPERTDCKWLGVGGQVLTIDKRPQTNVRLQMGGTLDGQPVELESLSGTSIQYGPAGYEFTLADHPVASSQTVWIRLIDENGLPLSERTYLSTYDSCQKNLTIVNFIRIRQ